jgi:BirA family biotin operon repressor/biotin-[acetyl-CoA-carboxylase] ligase
MKTTGTTLDAVVVGIGLNVNIAAEDFDSAYRHMATSLREEAGRSFRREVVAFHLCDYLGKWYQRLLCKGFEPIRERWLSLSVLTGRRIEVLFQGKVQEGVVVGIDVDGALLLDDGRGAVKRIIAGDASLMKG